MSRAEAWTRGPQSSRREGASGVFPSSASSPGSPARSEAGWSTDEQVRLRTIFDEHFDFVWRYIRRLGLMESDADDAAQQAFLVLARRLECIALGKERSFLCGTAVRVVSSSNRIAVVSVSCQRRMPASRAATWSSPAAPRSNRDGGLRSTK